MGETITTRCCIAGGGPAGMMLGFLLARAGVDVVVLEKHSDFLRDFRGDTIHPSTMAVIDELGLLADFLRLPHQKVSTVGATFGDTDVTIADLGRLPGPHRYIAFIPQWDFLSFLADHGSRYPGFDLRMDTEAVRLIEAEGRVAGVVARSPTGDVEIRAGLTVAADGRSSILRAQSRLPLTDFGAPMDVLWFRLEKPAGSGVRPLGRFVAGKILVMIDRGAYWQCGYVIPKGVSDEIRSRGFDAFRREIAQTVPGIEGVLARLGGWDDVKLLSVQVNRLEQWYRPSFLCIGDAAHAMSPVAGVGINLAIQDAVAAANELAEPLRSSTVGLHHLRGVQRRRQWPTRVTQWFQLLIQNRVISQVLHEKGRIKPPPVIGLMRRFPFLTGLPARLIGLGVRPEHVRSPDNSAGSGRRSA